MCPILLLLVLGLYMLDSRLLVIFPLGIRMLRAKILAGPFAVAAVLSTP